MKPTIYPYLPHLRYHPRNHTGRPTTGPPKHNTGTRYTKCGHYRDTTLPPPRPEARDEPRDNCRICMEQPADTSLNCGPRHKLCLSCAHDPRLRNCTFCRWTLKARIPAPPFDDPTYEYAYVQIYNIQLLTYTDYSTYPDPPPPPPPAYNVCTQSHRPTRQLWEAHLRRDLPHYATAPHNLHDRHNGRLPNGHVSTVLAAVVSPPNTKRPPPCQRHQRVVARTSGR